jgi:hypothetical protein
MPNNVETIAEEFVDIKEEVSLVEYAPTIVATFDSVKGIIANAPPPRRPNRNAPVEISRELADELEAWQRISAEASNDHGWE